MSIVSLIHHLHIETDTRGVCVLQNPKCQLYHSFITSISKPTHTTPPTHTGTWLRLVGRRHDVMLWTQDTRMQNVFPHNDLLTLVENNDDAVFESFRRRRFPAVDKWFLRKDSSKNHRTYLGLFMPHARRITELESVDSKKMTTSQKSELHNLKQKAKSTPPQIKEVVVYDDTTIHVFNVTEWGRRYFRTIVYTNSSALCLHDFSAKLIYRGKAARPCLVGGDPRRYWTTRSSLLVLRNLNLEIGPQLYIPERLLRGIVRSLEFETIFLLFS